MKTFKHIHSSSRFDRTTVSLDNALDAYIRHQPDLITLTEVARERREKPLRRTGWDVITGDKSGWDDCAIMYSTNRYKVLHSESFDMGGTGRYAQIAVLLDKAEQKRLVVASVHYPASVEYELFKKVTSRDTVLWTKAVWSLKRRVNALKRKFKARGIVIAADWNVDFKKEWVRALIKAIHPSYSNTWQAPYPARGTHGRRVIDATLFKGRLKTASPARLLKDDDSSDHRPYINSLAWTA